MGGMAAFIPSRKDADLNERALAKVRDDKQARGGRRLRRHLGGHPDLVPVALDEFDAVLGERPNQLERQRDEVEVRPADLLDVAATPGAITEEGLRNDVSVGIQYLSAWLRGSGAVAIDNLMEDAATAEIARSQVWQWVRHGHFTREQVRGVIDDELARLRAEFGDEVFERSRADEARELFEEVALGDELVEFLTIPAYENLD
jgi:malate synthase